jgi:ATP-dependent RNA helicase RhlE
MFKKSHSHRFFRSDGRHGKYVVTPEAAAVAANRGSEYIHKTEAIQPDEEPDRVTVSFDTFPLDSRLKENIADRGYELTTPIQEQAIPHVLAGRDVVGIANTGTGKTAAFLVPLINRQLADPSIKILVVVPTRELAMQVNDELALFSRNLGMSSVLCIGGAGMGPQIAGLRRNPGFVIATPGRLKDLIQRGHLRLDACRVVVLDEVDRMVDAGFIRDIRYIISLLPVKRQSLFFSATVSSDVDGIIRSFLTDPVMVSVKRKETAASVDQDIIRVMGREDKMEKLDHLLQDSEFSKVLIFGRTKWGVEKLARALRTKGYTVDSIHGNKSQSQRFKALEQFKQNRLRILVATDIAARGLDIEDVTHVINFDEPSTYTDYVHRIGRTGRANKSGKALTFVE